MIHAISHYETDQRTCPRGGEAVICDQHIDICRDEELLRTEIIRNIYCERSNGSCISFNLGKRPDVMCWECDLAE